MPHPKTNPQVNFMFNDKNTKFVITWGSARIFATNLKFKKQKIISKEHLDGQKRWTENRWNSWKCRLKKYNSFCNPLFILMPISDDWTNFNFLIFLYYIRYIYTLHILYFIFQLLKSNFIRKINLEDISSKHQMKKYISKFKFDPIYVTSWNVVNVKHYFEK